MTAPPLWVIKLAEAADNLHGELAASKAAAWASQMQDQGDHEAARIWKQVAAYLSGADAEPTHTLH